MIHNFNDGWICRSSCGEWREVTLPHDAMIESARDEKSGVPDIGWFSGCDVEYKKVFKRPNGQRFVFEFEGVYKDAEVYINGDKAGENSYGYIGFFVDATEFLKEGDNEIRVVVHNSDQPNSRWYTGTGIYRPVRLFALPASHILPNGIKIRTLSVAPATVEVRVKTEGVGRLEVEIEKDGKTVASKSFDVTGDKSETSLLFDVRSAELWSPDAPNLYTCSVKFGDDKREELFGIRLIECSAKNGFTINGERVILRGACVHHDNGIVGARCFTESEERKVELLKNIGYNAVRSAHNPCSRALIEACDRRGMLVVDEYADMWYIHKSRYDYSTHLASNYEKDISAMVDKDFNHPSVVMYSLGNEVAETGEKRGIELLKSMVEVVKAKDDRPVTVGINPFFNYLYSLGLGQYSDKKAAKGSKKKVGSAFFNALAGKFGAGFMKTMARLCGCDRRTRDAYALLDAAGYNYGIKRYEHDLKKYPERVILGSETFCADAYAFFETAKREPRIIGDFVWAGADYIGEVGVGAWERKSYAPVNAPAFGWMTAGSGRLDLAGNENGEALYTRVALEIEPGPKIAVSPVSKDRRHTPSAWKFTDALESWSWGKENDGVKTRVEVYSRAPIVELYINGRKVGKKKFKKNCRFDFFVKYESGELTAVERDKNGAELSRAVLRSAGDETAIDVCAEKKRADDGIYYIPIRYADLDGVWKPHVDGTLEISVEGGELIAFGNARPFNEDGFCGTRSKTYYGRALAVVRAFGGARITVTDGKIRAELELP